MGKHESCWERNGRVLFWAACAVFVWSAVIFMLLFVTSPAWQRFSELQDLVASRNYEYTAPELKITSVDAVTGEREVIVDCVLGCYCTEEDALGFCIGEVKCECVRDRLKESPAEERECVVEVPWILVNTNAKITGKRGDLVQYEWNAEVEGIPVIHSAWFSRENYRWECACYSGEPCAGGGS